MSRPTQVPDKYLRIFTYRAITFCGWAFHPDSINSIVLSLWPYNPNLKDWFRLLPFRSPLLRESLLISIPPVTKMFQFTGFALLDLYIQSEVTG